MLQTSLKKKLILVAIIVVAALIFWSSTMLQDEYLQMIGFFEKNVAVRPIFSVVVFIILSALSVLFFFFSSVLLVPVAVSVWGSLITTLLLLAGWILGAIISYILGRYAGYPILKYIIPLRKLEYYRSLFSKDSSLLLIFLVRFTAPSEIPGFALGIFHLPFLKYLLITIFAEIPYAFVTVYAIGAILNKDPIVLGAIIFMWLISTGLLARLLYKSFSNK